MASRHELETVFSALARSSFRRRFRLTQQDRDYLDRHGLTTIRQHARTLIERRLAAARPHKDGRQTPMRGHPVFIAQHATATCCRGCLSKWHGIAPGQALSDHQCRYVLAVLEHWLRQQHPHLKAAPAPSPQGPAAQPTPDRQRRLF